jgi:hypothetical protein
MAQARAEGIIPAKYPTTTSGKDSVNSFIMYHFVKDAVVFDDGKLEGNFKTNRTYKNEEGVNTNSTLHITNSIPKNLSVQDIAKQSIDINHEKANILVRKGVCHKIDTVLKYYE